MLSQTSSMSLLSLSLLTLSSSFVVAGSTSSHSKFVKHLKREVPQEHSHEQFITTVRASLQLDNPRNIHDPIFGLLGNAAAAQGASGIDPTCLQQATADQAFTNAKAKGDVAGMTAALVYRALERNTPGVGKASAPCVLESAKNPEIAALHQHQDPASPNAAALNKATTLALAVQIAAIGGDASVALKSGTFSPGDLSDNSGRGNTCDDQNDPTGCIFTQNKLVEDASLAEIQAAVAGSGGKGSVAASTVSSASIATLTPSASIAASVSQVTVTVQPTDCPAVVTSATLSTSTASATAFANAGEDCVDSKGSVVSAASAQVTATAAAVSTVTVTSTVTVSATNCATTASSTAASVSSSSSSSSSQFANNLQKFTGALGNIVAPAVAVGGRGFIVDGEPNSSDLRVVAALQRSCSIQHNKCANLANSGKGSGFSVGDCDTQNNACQAA